MAHDVAAVSIIDAEWAMTKEPICCNYKFAFASSKDFELERSCNERSCLWCARQYSSEGRSFDSGDLYERDKRNKLEYSEYLLASVEIDRN